MKASHFYEDKLNSLKSRIDERVKRKKINMIYKILEKIFVPFIVLKYNK